MPGPGRGKSKSKSKTTRYSAGRGHTGLAGSYVNEIDNAAGWEVVINILCKFFEIPDLTTRSGLKRVHANFEAIAQRLDKAYENNPTKEKLLGGIIGIYAKMCADSILRNKLFDNGLLSKLIPLLDMPRCRHLALIALSTVTHHGGESIRVEIAQTSSTLIRLIQEFPDDPKVAELAIVCLAHSAGAIVNVEGDREPDPKRLRTLDMPAILRVITENVRKPTASRYLIDHAINFLAGCTLNCPKDCHAYPPVLTLLVATLRCNDIICRCTALGALIRLHRHESEEHQITLDPVKLVACVKRGFPEPLSNIMMQYGVDRCETYIMLKTSTDYQKAMMKCAQNHDLYALGLTLSQLILRTEFSVYDGAFQADNSITGEPESIDVGLPFKSWLDALPHCALAIRAKGNPTEEDAADILQLKYFILKRRIADAVDYAKKAINRSPDVAYFYYAITLTADASEGLRFAKKGMKCKKTSPFVRFQMMQRAVEHAGDMGICILQDSPTVGGGKWEEGVAFLMSAMEDSKAYVEQAPPDNHHMKNVLCWFILLALTLRGSELSADLRELEGTFKELQAADNLSKFLGMPPSKTDCRMAQRTIVKLYPKAVQEWSQVIARFDELNSGHPKEEPLSSQKAEDNLASWLNDMQMDDAGQDDHPSSCTHPKISTNQVELYRCSWCGNPSAALRKCSGCDKTRYCDAGCQKAHWRDHKKTCQRV